MKKYFFLFCELISCTVKSQNFIYSSIEKKPIGGVHILFNENKGIISNDDGYFELPKNSAIDSIHFSHLSYRSKILTSAELKKNDTIFLEKVLVELDEIALNNIKPKEIIIAAINRIDKNYVKTPHNLFGFFRQSLKENSKGVEMTEVEYINYTKDDNISTKIVKGRRTENYTKWGLKTNGGVSAMIGDGDFVRRKAYFLDLKIINDYEFIYEGSINHNGLKVHKISFSPINEKKLQNLRKGTLYIDSISRAIVEIRYTFDKEKLVRLTEEQSKQNVNAKKAVYILQNVENVIKYYQLPNKKWSLYYIDFSNLLKGVYDGKANYYELKAKLIVNNTKIKNVVKVKSNYNLSKDFNKAVKKFEKLENWNDTYKFSLSNEEKKVLKDINDNKNK